MVQHHPQFLHAKDLTHFINDAAHKVGTPITHEADQGPKDQDVTLIQELGAGFSSLIGGYICQYVLGDVVLEHKDIGDFRWFVQLHSHLYAGNIYVQEV